MPDFSFLSVNSFFLELLARFLGCDLQLLPALSLTGTVTVSWLFTRENILRDRVVWLDLQRSHNIDPWAVQSGSSSSYAASSSSSLDYWTDAVTVNSDTDYD